MTSRRSIVVIDEFYRDPHAVREYAVRQAYYTPYEDEAAIRAGYARATWWASRFRLAPECPFKSSTQLIGALEQAVGERIDMAHWNAGFPLDRHAKPSKAVHPGERSCVWNCCFHLKPENGQQLGDGVHNHVVDCWNAVGVDGWAGIVYLSPAAPLDGGLNLWRNRDPARQFDWMTPACNWERVDSFGNVFNRLILVRGDVPHSGAGGWGRHLHDGRLYQTFFFRTVPEKTGFPVAVSLAGE